MTLEELEDLDYYEAKVLVEKVMKALTATRDGENQEASLALCDALVGANAVAAGLDEFHRRVAAHREAA